MSTTLLLGIDVSTTGVKALLVNERGHVIASETTAVPLSTPRALWSEQEPEDWWRATCASVRAVLGRPEIDAARIAAVGLTGQMHGLVLLDEGGKPLRPAILWNDQRTGAECDAIRSAVGRERLIEVTGNDALTGFTAPKLLWVQRHEPEVYARARALLLPKDYVRFRLTGTLAMDKADGSGTLLFDLARRDWSAEITSAVGVPREWLPPTYEGPATTGCISSRGAADTGLRDGTPVVAGGGDQSAGAVGVGAVDPGMVSVVLGTSGVVFATTESPVVEPNGRLHAFCHAVPGRWHLMGVMLSAAGSLQWYRDTMAPSEPFDAILAEADSAPAGADGLVFLPYLTGERTPYPDPLARGAFVGLTRRHSRAHLTRAVLEGVAFGLRDCYELIVQAPSRGFDPSGTDDARRRFDPSGSDEAKGSDRAGRRFDPSGSDDATAWDPAGRRFDPSGSDKGGRRFHPSGWDQAVRISGGGAKSALWRRIVATVLGTVVEQVNSTEGAAFGAALLAGVGSGVWPDVATACREAIAVTRTEEPNDAWSDAYARAYGVYRNLYPALKESFEKLRTE